MVSFHRRWWTIVQRVEVHDGDRRWMQAVQLAQDLVKLKGCTKAYVVLKMRRYTNPGAVKQSAVEIFQNWKEKTL